MTLQPALLRLGGRNMQAGVGMLLVASVSCSAQAQTSASFQAKAEIVSGCEINADLPAAGQAIGEIGVLDFGTHSALSTETASANLVQNTSFALRCSPGVSLAMVVNEGQHSTTGLRNMQTSTGMNQLSYRLYSDSTFHNELTENLSVPVTFSGSAPIVLPIYGSLTLPGGKPAGAYSDTVVVTLNW